jgi:solute:Na+ symporter, SSS family
MPALSTVDLVIIALYILGMTLLGVWFTKDQKDLRTYFVGGRGVGWFMVLMSIVATETSAVTFLSVPGLGYKPEGGNLTFLQLSLGYIVGRCVVAWFLLPQYMEGNLFSAYQVLQMRFSPAVQRVASGLFLITRTVADGLRIFLTALLLQYVGWGVGPAILVVGIVTIIYTYLGGMKAVIWTDLIQFVIKISGAILAGFFVLKLLPGGWTEFLADGDAANRFKMFDLTWNLASDGNLWAGLFGGAVFSMASHGADQLMVQRYLCAKSLFQARLALVLSGFTIAVQFLLFLSVGIGMYLLREKGLFPEAFNAKTNDDVFGLFIITKLPIGVVGILVAAVLAAAMSTLSSSLNSSANAFVTDFYRPLRPNHDEKYYVTLSRIMTAVWGVAQMSVAFIAVELGSTQSVVKQVLGVAGFTTGLLLGLFILGSLPIRMKSLSALIGLVIGFCAVFAVWLTGQRGTPILAWPWFAPVGTGTTVLVALALHMILGSPDGHAAAPTNGSPEPPLGSAR